MPSDPGWLTNDLIHEENDKNNKKQEEQRWQNNKQTGNKNKSKQQKEITKVLDKEPGPLETPAGWGTIKSQR